MRRATADQPAERELHFTGLISWADLALQIAEFLIRLSLRLNRKMIKVFQQECSYIGFDK
ncbi:hypothetical protein [Sphingobacterium paludis]|nr:hypothetical protein [Sphingobacterium paludis]